MYIFDAEGTAKNIRWYLKENHITQAQLAEYCNVSASAVHKWVCAIAMPTFDNLIIMTNLFECTLDNLVAKKFVEKYEKSSKSFTILLKMSLIYIVNKNRNI